MPSGRRGPGAALLGAVLLLGTAAAQEKKEPPKSPLPKIAFAQPFAIVAGKPAKLSLRGLNLDAATEAKIEGATVAIKGKGKAEVPKEQDPGVYGDTKLDLEVTLPAGSPSASITVTNPSGVTGPYVFEVLAPDAVLAEKEPNGGFAEAQAWEAGKSVMGAIGQAQDVDCFRIEAKKGETWEFEAVAQRRGSPLDAMLTLHDPKGRIVLATDDGSDSRDPVLKAKITEDGPHVLVLMDAQNVGGSTHVYVLRARRLP